MTRNVATAVKVPSILVTTVLWCLLLHELISFLLSEWAQELYNEGARTILVKDVGPQGCQPFWLTYFGHSPNDFDSHGCSISYNDAVRYYNGLLKGQIAAVRDELKGANVIYVNTYDVIYEFIAEPSHYVSTNNTFFGKSWWWVFFLENVEAE